MRKQVNLDLNTPALRATNQLAGQYSVAVQATPKTNQALQLAAALRVAPQLLGQAANIGEEAGKTAAGAIATQDVAAELKATDPEAFDIFKKQKGFRDALLKRNAETVLAPAFTAALGSIDPTEFSTVQDFEDNSINKTIEEQKAAYMDSIGAAGATEEAQAVFNLVSDNFRTNAMVNYNKAQTEAIEEASIEETGVLMGGFTAMQFDDVTGERVPMDLSNFGSFIKERDAAMNEAGLSNSERSKALVAAANIEIKSLLAKGRKRDAQRLYDTVVATKPNGVDIFNTSASKEVLTPVLQSLTSNTEKLDKEAVSSFADIVVDSYAGLRDPELTLEETSPTQKKVMLKALQLSNPTASEEELESMFSGVFEGNGTALQNFSALIRESAVNGTDAVSDMYFDSRKEIDYSLGLVANRPMSPLLLSDERQASEIEEFDLYMAKNPTKSARDFVKDENKPYNTFPALDKRSTELTAGQYVLDTDTYKNIGSDLNKVVDVIEDEFDLPFAAPFVSSVKEDVESQLLDYAKSVAGDENALDLVKAESKRLFEATNDYLKGMARGSSIELTARTEAQGEQLELADDSVGGGRNKVTYGSLKSERPDRATIDADINTAVERGHGSQLGLILYRHGFDSYTPESAKSLSAAGLDAGDVRLFASTTELQGITSTWNDTLGAMTGIGSLNEEQRATRDQMSAFGVYDYPTLAKFIALQQSLLKL